jgi:2-dehydropantoate 2-reductase
VVRTPEDVPAATAALEVMMARAAPTKASMLQDLERGARTEVDVINGGVVATADRLGLRAPLNREVVAIVHEYEQGIGRPGPAAYRRIADLIPSPVREETRG